MSVTTTLIVNATMTRKQFNEVKKAIRASNLWILDDSTDLMTCSVMRNGLEADVGVFMIRDSYESAMNKVKRLIKKQNEIGD